MEEEKRVIEEFAPARIHLVQDQSLQEDKLLADLVDNSDSVFWRAIDVLSKALMVRPLQSNHTFSPFCDEYTDGPNAGYCITGTIDKSCGIFTVPDELVNYVMSCPTNNSNCSKEGPDGPGVAADYILIVGALDSKLMCLVGKFTKYHLSKFIAYSVSKYTP